MTDNELIAKFMGEPFGKNADKNGLIPYHKSWDWLMPVVEKISLHVYEEYTDHNGYKEVPIKCYAYPRTFAMPDYNGEFMVRFNRCVLFQNKSLINATYEAVVDFIKRYNQNKKS